MKGKVIVEMENGEKLEFDLRLLELNLTTDFEEITPNLRCPKGQHFKLTGYRHNPTFAKNLNELLNEQDESDLGEE